MVQGLKKSPDGSHKGIILSLVARWFQSISDTMDREIVNGHAYNLCPVYVDIIREVQLAGGPSADLARLRAVLDEMDKLLTFQVRMQLHAEGHGDDGGKSGQGLEDLLVQQISHPDLRIFGCTPTKVNVTSSRSDCETNAITKPTILSSCVATKLVGRKCVKNSFEVCGLQTSFHLTAYAGCTWAEDRALRTRNPSTDSGAEVAGGGESRPSGFS
jgi:hypothetical protein